jgi:restriction endonuclease S subunit
MRDGWVATSLSEVVEHTIGGVWGGESGADEVEVTVVRSTEFTKRGFLNFETGVPRSIKSSQLKSRELKPGDILLEKSGGGPDQPVGRVVFVTEAIPEKFVCSNFVQLVRPNSEQIEPLLLFHIMWQWHAINRTLEFQAQTTGIRNLRTPDYLEQEINLPPLREQKRIVDLISSVDSYIESLQQQLENAKRSRNAVLHDLLTAGSDGWLRAGLSEICTMIKRGQAPSYTEQKSVTVLNQKCVRNGRIQFEFARQTDSNIKPINEWAFLTSDDTLVNSTGVGTLGRVAFVGTHDEPLTVDSHLTIVRPDRNKIHPSFLGLSLHFREADIEGLAAGSSGQTELSREALGNLIITIPPLPEQKRIVEIIASLDKVANQTQLSITESQNLRSGLLSDLLSGEHEIPSSYDKVIGAA